MANQSTPEVPAFIEVKRGQRVAFIRCPYCGDVHQHGAGLTTEPADLGYREAHCLTGPGGAYRLVPGLSEKPRGFSSAERTRRLLAEDRGRGLPYIGRVY